MKAKFIGIPVAILGALVIAWWYLTSNNEASAATVPNTSASGVPQWTPALDQYSINPPTLTPSPIISLNPFVNPSGDANYLTYNRPPSHDLSKTPNPSPTPTVSDCGCDSCGSGCADNNSQFTDGQGSVCMTTTPKHQVNDLAAKYPDVWKKYEDNLKSAGVEFNMVPDDAGGGSLGNPNPPAGFRGVVNTGAGLIGQTEAMLPRAKEAFGLLRIPYGDLTA